MSALYDGSRCASLLPRGHVTAKIHVLLAVSLCGWVFSRFFHIAAVRWPEVLVFPTQFPTLWCRLTNISRTQKCFRQIRQYHTDLRIVPAGRFARRASLPLVWLLVSTWERSGWLVFGAQVHKHHLHFTIYLWKYQEAKRKEKKHQPLDCATVKTSQSWAINFLNFLQLAWKRIQISVSIDCRQKSLKFQNFYSSGQLIFSLARNLFPVFHWTSKSKILHLKAHADENLVWSEGLLAMNLNKVVFESRLFSHCWRKTFQRGGFTSRWNRLEDLWIPRVVKITLPPAWFQTVFCGLGHFRPNAGFHIALWTWNFVWIFFEKKGRCFTSDTGAGPEYLFQGVIDTREFALQWIHNINSNWSCCLASQLFYWSTKDSLDIDLKSNNINILDVCFVRNLGW